MEENIFVTRDVLDKPEKFAKLLFEALKKEFANMSAQEFDRLVCSEMEKQYIRLGDKKIPVAENYKKAIWHYVAFLYYCTTPN